MSNNSFLKNISRGIQSKLKKLSTNPYRKVNLNWFKIKYYKHLPAGKIKTHTLFNTPLYFFDPVQLVNGLEEIFIEEAYLQQLQDEPYIIDCGANIGLSIIYMKRLYPKANILAFEPDELNFELLSKNVKSFGYSDVILRKEAVWIEDTELQFSNAGSMSSRLEMTAVTGSVTVQAKRLKQFLDRKVDFLKLDIEGAEYLVLKDIEDCLHRVKNLFVEYHGTFSQNNELAELIGIINKNGFNFYIKEAAPLFDYPFYRKKKSDIDYDVQLNIFCFRAEA